MKWQAGEFYRITFFDQRRSHARKPERFEVECDWEDDDALESRIQYMIVDWARTGGKVLWLCDTLTGVLVAHGVAKIGQSFKRGRKAIESAAEV